MSNQVQIYTRNVYGQPKVYPANEQAEIFAALAGTKTFSRLQLVLIEKLGYTITPVFDPATVRAA